MKVGVTGTRTGWTPEQHKTFVAWMVKHKPTEFHHGGCDGVDTQATDIVDMMLVGRPTIVCHPPVDEKHYTLNTRSDEFREPKTHFARNRDIVDESDLLIVIPWSTEWQPNGGTWYTHDYAKKQNKPVVVIWPDGTYQARYAL